MPRFPELAVRGEALGASVFEKYLPLLAASEKPMRKLHIGDSHRLPEHPVPLDPGFLERHPHSLQYPNTHGTGRLRRGLSRLHETEHHWPVPPEEDLLVTSGGTHALSATFQAILDPGDEVVVLTPAWPFTFGMIRLAGGVVVEVPFHTETGERIAALTAAIGPRTVAIYVNTPNNPSGRVLDAPTRAAILRLARDHDLWLVCDEAYDGMVFDGVQSRPFATEEGASECSVSAFTFSKIHLAAGLRLGWLRGPREVLARVHAIAVHQVYSPSALSQAMMSEAVETRAEWAPRVRSRLQKRRDDFFAALDLGIEPCVGTYFAFLDATPWQRGRSREALVEGLLREGIGVTPGDDFGQGYESWLRFCFASESESDTLEAARRIGTMLRG